jgi:hypothetical protein
MLAGPFLCEEKRPASVYQVDYLHGGGKAITID